MLEQIPLEELRARARAHGLDPNELIYLERDCEKDGRTLCVAYRGALIAEALCDPDDAVAITRSAHKLLNLVKKTVSR